MNLLDLFEDNIPSHIKPSDIPPAMRNRKLTMRDIDAERPQSIYRFRVGDKNFMDLGAAQTFAAGTGQKVERIAEEQLDEQEVDVPATMNPQNRGAMVLTVLEKDKEFARMSRRPIRINMAGEQFVITDPDVKNRILTMATSYKKKGALPNFLLNLGQPDSLHYLLTQLGGQDDVAVGGQGATPRAARYANEEKDSKKKDNISEREGLGNLTPRAQRIMQQVRMRQPQARGDIEALTYDYERQQKKDRTDIERLEKEQGDLESDIRQDLEKAVGTLRGRKGVSTSALDQIEKSDRAQNAAINRILQLDKEQQKAIDDLERSMGKEPSAEPRRATVTQIQPKPQPVATPKSTPVVAPRVTDTGIDYSPAPAKAPTGKTIDLFRDVELAPKQRKQKTKQRPPAANEPQMSLVAETETMAVRVARDEQENVILDEAGKDACYHKVRSRYKVWPSAYASGALVQCRKKGAANWGNKSK